MGKTLHTAVLWRGCMGKTLHTTDWTSVAWFCCHLSAHTGSAHREPFSYVRACVRACMSACMSVCACTYVCECKWIYVCKCACGCACVCACAFVYVCILCLLCVQECMYIFVSVSVIEVHLCTCVYCPHLCTCVNCFKTISDVILIICKVWKKMNSTGSIFCQPFDPLLRLRLLKWWEMAETELTSMACMKS